MGGINAAHGGNKMGMKPAAFCRAKELMMPSKFKWTPRGFFGTLHDRNRWAVTSQRDRRDAIKREKKGVVRACQHIKRMKC